VSPHNQRGQHTPISSLPGHLIRRNAHSDQTAAAAAAIAAAAQRQQGVGLTTALDMGSSSPDSSAVQPGMGRPALSFICIVSVLPPSVSRSDSRNSHSPASTGPGTTAWLSPALGERDTALP
jgi:hypothetical protein